MTTEHGCVSRINEQIADRNMEISTPISVSDPTRELIQITTCKRDISKRSKPVAVFASFCPFCGKSLTKEPT